MARSNTTATYGSVTKTFHWLTALLILTLIPLGWYANQLPFDTGAELAVKAQLFSYHKTLGIAAFFVAVLRILWALTQPKPAPLHPNRKVETILAETVHWSLYAALVVVPLSGWLHHAATSGFAPILWPLGQSLPLIPQSDSLAGLFSAIHWVFTKILIASILLHVAGALKHALIDRDQTLARMMPGTPILKDTPQHWGLPDYTPILAAGTIYTVGFILAVTMSIGVGHSHAPDAPRIASAGHDHGADTSAPAAMDHSAHSPAPAAMDHSDHAALAPEASDTPEPQTTDDGWTVTEGTLALTVRQLGSDVTGSFAEWEANITFDDTPTDGKHGQVTVRIAIPSLTLGSVTSQALGTDFFAADSFPAATFAADILPAETGYVATGTLMLKGMTVPVTLPFTLDIAGNTATMSGETTLDRRDFGIGDTYPDETSLGFTVKVTPTLTATRTPPKT